MVGGPEGTGAGERLTMTKRDKTGKVVQVEGNDRPRKQRIRAWWNRTSTVNKILEIIAAISLILGIGFFLLWFIVTFKYPQIMYLIIAFIFWLMRIITKGKLKK